MALAGRTQAGGEQASLVAKLLERPGQKGLHGGGIRPVLRALALKSP